MTIIPAIDIRGGKAVRLFQGDFSKETVYSDSPLDLARRFTGDGARRIHVVDLDGAREGEPKEAALIREMASQVSARFQVGGGIRDPKLIDAYLKAGVWRVVVGTRAALDAGFLKEILQSFRDSLIVGVDASNGMVATDGWTKVTDIKAETLVDRVASLGGEEIVYTDISKDGAMKGPNLDQVRRIASGFPVRVIASGGVSSLDDVKSLIGLNLSNLSGVIIGKAIYEGKVDLKAALRLC